MNVYLEPQHRIQSRISNYREHCEKLSEFLQEWQAVVAQIGTVERKQESVLRSKSARAIEVMSIDVQNSLTCHIAEVEKFKSKLLEQFSEIERSCEGIFGAAVGIKDDGSSSSAVGGPAQLIAEGGIGASASGADGWSNVGSGSSEGGISVGMEENVGGGAAEKKDERKERVLVGVKETRKMNAIIRCQKAVFNWETREVMCLSCREGGVISVIGVNEANDKLELKRTMEWDEIRGSKDYLWDICMDEVNNTMYGVVTQKEGQVKRVEELDQCSLKKKGSSKTELDTRGLLNGEERYWFLVSKRDTIALAALAVVDYRGGHYNLKWDSVAIYRNRVRRVHTLSHLNLKLKGYLYWGGCVLVNETTLLFSCECVTNTVAVVSLPPHSLHNQTSSSSSSPSSSADRTVNVKYVIVTGVDRVWSLVWTPSGQPHEGYLWVGDFNTRVYKVDLETDLKNVETGNETQLQVHKMSPIDNRLTQLCSTDDSTIFAISEGNIYSGYPVLIKLKFSSA